LLAPTGSIVNVGLITAGVTVGKIGTLSGPLPETATWVGRPKGEAACGGMRVT
jgi:hypothetical protein